MLKRLLKSQVFSNNILYSGSSFFFRLFNTLLIFSIAARLFSVSQFGLLSFFLTIVIVIYTSLDFGHRIKIVKDVSSDIDKLSSNYIGNKVWLKIILFGLVSIILFGYAFWKDFWEYHKVVTIFILLSGLFKGLTNLYFAIFQGKALFREETKSLGLFSFLIAIVLFICYLRPSIAVFSLGYMLASGLQLIYTHYLIKRSIVGFDINSMIIPFSWKSIVKEIKLGYVFASIVIIEILFSSFDSFYVENHYLKEDLGYYEAFKKIFMGLNIFAMILAVAIFPEISKRIKNSSKDAYFFILKSLGLILGVGALLLLVYVVFNNTIIEIVLGNQYSKLTTWDTHIVIITMSSYLRVMPNLYFVSSGKEQYRFIITGLFFLVELFCFIYLLRESGDIRHAIKMLTYVHLGFTFCSLAIFTFLFFKWRLNLKSTYSV